MSTFESRLTELETKISYQEDLAQELNRTISQQQQVLDQLKHSFRVLNEKIQQLSNNLPSGLDGAEKPPHY